MNERVRRSVSPIPKPDPNPKQVLQMLLKEAYTIAIMGFLRPPPPDRHHPSVCPSGFQKFETKVAGCGGCSRMCVEAQGMRDSQQPGVLGHAGYAHITTAGCAWPHRAPASCSPCCRRVCAAAQVTRARSEVRRPRCRAKPCKEDDLSVGWSQFSREESRRLQHGFKVEGGAANGRQLFVRGRVPRDVTDNAVAVRLCRRRLRQICRPQVL